MDGKATDILVIGAGGAGLRAALAASETAPELKVTVMTQGQVDRDSLTANACSDRMAFHVAFEHTPPGGEIAWRTHAEDIYIGGRMVSDPNLAELLARHAKDAFTYLDKLCVPWVRDANGVPDQFRTDGSEYPRACYTGPYTARDIHEVLLKKARDVGIEIIENRHLIGMWKPEDADSLWAISGWDENAEDVNTIYARSVILATGGPGGIFGSRLFSKGADAIPYYLALLAGANLVNLEFIQFGLVSPLTRLACSGSIPRALPKVINQDGDEILLEMDLPGGVDTYLELLFMKGASWPVSSESAAFAVDKEISSAVSRGEKIYFDFRENPSGLDEEIHSSIIKKAWDSPEPLVYAPSPYERLMKDNPLAVEWFAERGVKLNEESVEVRHEAQHFQGGIHIDENAETGVPGLYACGECAGGQHGGNRPGGNSLMDCQVMGAVAGSNAAEFALGKKGNRNNDSHSVKLIHPDIERFFSDDGLTPDEISAAVAEILKTEMGVIRTHGGLLKALKEIDLILQRGVNPEGNNQLRLISSVASIVIARVFLISAWLRNESRGSHICVDSDANPVLIPADEEYSQHWLMASIDDGNEIIIDKVPIPKLREENG